MHSLWYDVKHVARTLSRNPGLAMAAVLTLALGIGATSAIFSMLNGVLFHPLAGVEHPENLVEFVRVQPNFRFTNWSYPDYLDYRDRSRTLSGLAARGQAWVNFSNGLPERVPGEMVSGNYFSVLGARAARGRLIAPGDDGAPGASPVVVLSYELWQRAFGADDGAIGKTVLLNGHPFAIIGVAARDFHGSKVGSRADLWTPLAMEGQIAPTLSASILRNRSAGWIALVGRLAAGVSVRKAQAEMAAITAQLAQAYPDDSRRTVALSTRPGIDPDDAAELGRFLALIFGAAILFVLAACGNVASLLLARAKSRQREIALRVALGAGRGRLIRQLVTEGLLLSSLAGSAGMLLTPWIADLTVALRRNSYLMRNLDLSPDWRVPAFAIGLSLFSGVLFGLWPALQVSKPDLAAVLKKGSAGGGRRPRLARLLVMAQVGLSLVLLTGAGLLIRTLRGSVSLNPSLSAGATLLASVDLGTAGYTRAQGEEFYGQWIERARTIPGVASVTLAQSVPPYDWDGSARMSVFRPGEEPLEELRRGREFELGLRVGVNLVTPRYFETLGIPLLAGRDFTIRDDSGAQPVAIINQALAGRLWPGENPIGKRIACPRWPYLQSDPPLEVVGVASNSSALLNSAAPPLIYFPIQQNYGGRATLIVRSAGSARDLAQAVRSQASALDQSLPVYAPETMQEHVADFLWRERMAVDLIGVFGLLTFGLAVIGIYGVVAQAAAGRTREIGIRMALGAERRDVLRMVVGEGFLPALVGIAAGAAATLPLGSVVTSLFHGVASRDPLTLAAVAALLAGMALAAGYEPARRAAKVDPVVALRHE